MTVDMPAQSGADNGLMLTVLGFYTTQARMFRGAFGAPPTSSRGASLQRGPLWLRRAWAALRRWAEALANSLRNVWARVAGLLQRMRAEKAHAA